MFKEVRLVLLYFIYEDVINVHPISLFKKKIATSITIITGKLFLNIYIYNFWKELSRDILDNFFFHC